MHSVCVCGFATRHWQPYRNIYCCTTAFVENLFPWQQ